MNGFGELPMHGLASQAMAQSLRAEALSRSKHTPRPPVERRVRYRLGKPVVALGSRIMGLRIDIPDPDCAQPA
ncbi:MAG: hypothetical protein OEX04_02985 [Acidimicrobiia bacterium]|nr:hypothetical protein [Acidimicrobiia bacterium]MDH4306419.1 hypothetical protein [Acidimicrobiia bacterium]MDH5293789.1 hypothetical protein [Acidimicrobiia bacterium]